MELEKYDRKLIGARLNRLRKQRGSTQEAVAEAVGCSTDHLGNVERGTTGISIELLLALCKEYHVLVENVFYDISDSENLGDDALILTALMNQLSDRERKRALQLLTAYVETALDKKQ